MPNNPPTGLPTIRNLDRDRPYGDENEPRIGDRLAGESWRINDPDGAARLQYQWLRDVVVIPGEPGWLYQLTAEDEESEITFRANYVDDAGYSEAVVSIAMLVPEQPDPGDFEPRRIGAEIQVNTEEADRQYIPAVTALENGGFAVVVRGYNGVNRLDVMVFDADGNKIGDANVPSWNDIIDAYPSIKALEDGNFAISWSEFSPEVGVGWQTHFQVFSDIARPVSEEIPVDVTDHAAKPGPSRPLPGPMTASSLSFSRIWTETIRGAQRADLLDLEGSRGDAGQFGSHGQGENPGHAGDGRDRVGQCLRSCGCRRVVGFQQPVGGERKGYCRGDRAGSPPWHQSRRRQGFGHGQQHRRVGFRGKCRKRCLQGGGGSDCRRGRQGQVCRAGPATIS